MKQGCRIELFADGRRRDSLDAQEILDGAEVVARERSLSRQTAIETALHERLSRMGFRLDDAESKRAVVQIDNVRRGERIPILQLQVEFAAPAKRPLEGAPEAAGTPTEAFFELERLYPEARAHEWYASLVGLDDHKERLLVELELLLYPERLETWSRTHHGRVLDACHRSRNRVPLVLFSGDVGTGKTALAETVGDALARRVGGAVCLLKLNTQAVSYTHLTLPTSDLV